jgi:hypothetical protein
MSSPLPTRKQYNDVVNELIELRKKYDNVAGDTKRANARIEVLAAKALDYLEIYKKMEISKGILELQLKECQSRFKPKLQLLDDPEHHY